MTLLHVLQSFCRYRHPRAGKAYASAVFKHLNTIERRLADDKPNRQAWLRLLKDLADFKGICSDETADKS